MFAIPTKILCEESMSWSNLVNSTSTAAYPTKLSNSIASIYYTKKRPAKSTKRNVNTKKSPQKVTFQDMVRKLQEQKYLKKINKEF